MPSASQFFCNGCKRKFQTQEKIWSHCTAKNHTFTVSVWACNICPNRKWFSSEGGLKSHVQALHGQSPGKKPVVKPHQSSQPPQPQKHKKKVSCHFCGKQFKTPSAYSQHLESRVHRHISRDRVTQAVQMLGIVPPITISQRIGYETTSSIVDVDSAVTSETQNGSPAHSGTVGHSSLWQNLALARTVSPAPVTTSIAPVEVVTGPPLAPAELHGELVPVSPMTPPTVTIGHIGRPDTTIYVPDDFIHLSVPYTCSMCADTFKSVIGLTAHMNSPVHDPKEFFCPNVKCNREFVVVSALIQHLESGKCGLASMDEIFDRFDQLTAGISRLLVTV